jgi:ABC-type Fe3+ transport system permease subunit
VSVLGVVLLAVGVLLLFVGRWFGRSAKEAAASPAEQSKQAARLYRTQELLLYVVAAAAILLGLVGLVAT